MKKFLSCLFSLVMCVSLLAGCNLIDLNKTKYFSQTVVEIVYNDNTKTKKFTNEDLLQAYNNYGYQFAQNGTATTAKEVLRQTAELMVQRYMLVEEIKTKISLTQNEKNTLKKQTYDSVNAQLLELEGEIRVEWDRVISQPDNETTEPEKLRDVFTEYKPTVKKETDSNGLNPKLVRVNDEEEEQVSDPGEFVQNVTDADISSEAMKRYLKLLKENNDKLGKKVKEQDLLKNEINRIYGILEENKYINKYQTELLNKADINSDAVVNAYKEKYKRDYEKYYNNEAAYHEAMASDEGAGSVYYHPNSGNEYVWVTHILFGFSDEQKAEIEKLKKDLESNTIEQSYYDARMAEVTSLDKTPVKYVNENGETVVTNAEAAFNDVVSGVNRYNAETNFTLRAEAFNNYIYKYNDDPGIMNKDFAYVVNLDTTVKDKMVKEFADEARSLFKADALKGSDVKGAISSTPVKTDYGYHVILNLGAVKNVVEYKNIDSLTWNALYNVKTQPALNKTLFNYEYDLLNLDANLVSTYLNGVIADLTSTAKKINYFDSRYEKLLENL